MKIEELNVLNEMAYSRKKAESVITGLERPINNHMIKLLVVQAHESAKAHWKKELEDFIDEVAEIRLKPDRKPPSEKFLFRILYDEPFGGVEIENVSARIQRIARDDAPRGDIAVEDVVSMMREFHTALAKAISQGARDFASLIDGL